MTPRQHSAVHLAASAMLAYDARPMGSLDDRHEYRGTTGEDILRVVMADWLDEIRLSAAAIEEYRRRVT